jgi:hypothetical protein
MCSYIFNIPSNKDNKILLVILGITDNCSTQYYYIFKTSFNKKEINTYLEVAISASLEAVTRRGCILTVSNIGWKRENAASVHNAASF